jgi:hypothetical protein
MMRRSRLSVNTLVAQYRYTTSNEAVNALLAANFIA